MDLRLAGKRALVGGSSRGLGAAIAAALVAEGARAALAARPSPALTTRAAELDGVAVAVDLATPEGPTEAVATAVDRLGGLDLLVVNTGGPPGGTYAQVTDAQWEAAIEGTFMSALRMLRAALPHLQDGQDPAVLIVLSSSVREPIPGLITSNALRPGLVGFLKTVVAEIAPVRVNGIAPGRIATARVAQLDQERARRAGTSVAEVQRAAIARIPLGRYGDPEEVGRVAAFLLSPQSSYIDGAVVPVDGGMIRSLP